MDSEPAGLQAAKYIAELGGHCITAYVNRMDEKYPLVKGWQNVATRDHGELEKLWRDHPFAWPGVVCRTDGLLVFDLDGRAATDWFRELCSSVNWTGEGAWIYRTPGRDQGCHIWFKWPREEWTLAPLHKAEVRGEGWSGAAEFRGINTWTLWAGAKRTSGEYEILQTPSVLEECPRELWLAFAAEAQQTVVSGGGGELRELSPEDAWERAPWVDGRKNAVAALAWHQLLRRGSEEEEEVLELCMAFAKECCLPELDPAVVERKVRYTAERVRRLVDERQEVLNRQVRNSMEMWSKRR